MLIEFITTPGEYFWTITGKFEPASASTNLVNSIQEPPHGKTNNLHRRKQRRRSA